jgi:ABC-2 type transport system permease protein
MAVYKRNYKRFEGQLTDPLWRFTILPRYSLQTVFESKLVTAFVTFCFLPHLVALILIYLKYNLGALGALNLGFLQFLKIDGEFFLTLFIAQTYLSFFLVTFVGPGLVAPDLANNALPLYLSRPFSKTEYICGKLSVLLILTSLITWVPGLLLVAVQTNQAGLSWAWDNLRIAAGIMAGSWTWIVTVSLVALALSAWVKMRPAAVFSLFGIFFITGSLGVVANTILHLDPAVGVVIDLRATMRTMWSWLLTGQNSYGLTFERGRLIESHVPAWISPVVLLFFCAVSLFLLVKKIRASEVVR